MKRISILLVLLVTFLLGCRKEDDYNHLPACIQEMINDFESNPNFYSDIKIYKFRDKLKTYYYLGMDIETGLIDGYVIDNECNYVCSKISSGGVVYDTPDCKWETFSDKDLSSKIVWEK